MADYVLDTHACLFALAAPRKLGTKARRAIEQAESAGETLWIPAAAAAEIAILCELGRTKIGIPALHSAFAASPRWRFQPLDWAQIDAFAGLAVIRDPFDRLIVSAARCAGAKLVTRDSAIQELGLVEVVWS